MKQAFLVNIQAPNIWFQDGISPFYPYLHWAPQRGPIWGTYDVLCCMACISCFLRKRSLSNLVLITPWLQGSDCRLWIYIKLTWINIVI